MLYACFYQIGNRLRQVTLHPFLAIRRTGYGHAYLSKAFEKGRWRHCGHQTQLIFDT
jgi:hypothetical protein